MNQAFVMLVLMAIIVAATALQSAQGNPNTSTNNRGSRYFPRKSFEALTRDAAAAKEVGLTINRSSEGLVGVEIRCNPDCNPYPPYPPYPNTTTPYPPITTYPPHPPTTPHPPTPPPCGSTPPPTSFPSLPSVTLTTNCDFCDHDLYTATCVHSAFECGLRCAANWMCTHFTYIANLNGGTCRLKSAPGSGGAWATSIPAPSPYVCGYIPKRCFSSIQLNICLGLDTFTVGQKKK